MSKLIGSSALVFGVLGFAIGSHAGTLLGQFIDALFALEGAYERPVSSPEVPGWLVAVVLIGVAAAVVVFMR
ncbi:MAG: hypothetical protein K8R60_07395 [Burkholderiales bacterium]|nr:hypothetical protein [Burkholderiales bacterium]